MAKKTETRPATATINPFGLRMQQELRERLEAAASESGRSLNAEIVSRLERSFSVSDMGMKGDALDLVGFLSLSLSVMLNDDMAPSVKDEIKASVSKITKQLGSRLLLSKDDEHAFTLETSAKKSGGKKRPAK
ncbi:Arc family DNA-binding protein [Stenotrophomonas maltophilia]|uniref:Arc family DNA-binding protein n=1 Tax=Stenotrophomonas maltophilia TaxID=40324 RepID=UPI0034DAE5B9